MLASYLGLEVVIEHRLESGTTELNLQDCKVYRALDWGSRGRHSKAVRPLLQRIDIEHSTLANLETRFRFAVIHGDTEFLELLLTKDCIELNTKDADGRTALSHAVDKRGEKNVVEISGMLLNVSRVDPNIPDNAGRTPFSESLKD